MQIEQICSLIVNDDIQFFYDGILIKSHKVNITTFGQTFPYIQGDL